MRCVKVVFWVRRGGNESCHGLWIAVCTIWKRPVADV